MNDILNFTTGPLFSFCLAMAILGSLRLVIITIADLFRSMKTAGDKKLPWMDIAIDTASWLFPFNRLFATRRLFSLLSFTFHATLILILIFHQDHILLIRRIAGISWPFIDRPIVDFLAIACILCAIFLLSNRIFTASGRTMSEAMDYFILSLILVVLISGFFASTDFNPFSHGAVLLVHAVCGNLILLLIPFSRLGHMVLYPILWVASAVAWKFPSDSSNRRGGMVID
ncbi:MAG TPA: hypothetical protein PKO25_04580 [Spirochaetota bacterium]|nr:hypothetical protein [Spirochaetota bacterium]OPZ39041.1 MAG: Nitrate reductase gamma subunit [Spirochaetes bacterium ADurb.BinA120]HNU91125.1 hypothetical protein [Spirochaetota bacterium]HPI13756.1 hypothetical protein [Spirochaetota bacterium]HPV96207.1 hypothetical protein [Spirochaetota bacterium]